MALNSPGVEVTIIDQSQYLPAAPSSVPLLLVATAQNKATPSGTAIAPGTTAANAGKLYAVTSQRDLVNLFGTPFFYKTTAGTPIQGYELNEYGLQTAYSLLGSTNLVYVLRADIDLAALIGTTGRPTGEPNNGAYWLDTTASTWGIREFNSTTGQFTVKTPIVIVDPLDATNEGAPQQYIGNIGDYAISEVYNASSSTTRWDAAAPNTYSSLWYKAGANIVQSIDPTLYNQWIKVGSVDWYNAWPAIIGSLVGNTLAVPTSGVNITVNYVDTLGVSGSQTATISWVGGATLGTVADAIGTAFTQISAFSTPPAGLNQRLNIRTTPEVTSIVIANAGPNNDAGLIGLTTGTFYPLGIVYGTNAQQPNWGSSQPQPRPSGSVWVLTNTSSGLAPSLRQYNTSSGTWAGVNVGVSTADWVYTQSVDSTGGRNIPAGAVYAQVNGNNTPFSPFQLWRRSATGPSVFTGSTPIANMSFTALTYYTFDVIVSVPGSASLSSRYNVNFSTGATAVTGQDAADIFVQAFQAAMIPNTDASSSGTYVTLTHTAGGTIILDGDSSYDSGLYEVVITNTTGQCTCAPVQSSYPLLVGQLVTVGMGLVSGQGSISTGTYRISVTDGSGTFTLVNNDATGTPITTTAGTTIGATFTRSTGTTTSVASPLSVVGFVLPNETTGVPTGSGTPTKFGPYNEVGVTVPAGDIVVTRNGTIIPTAMGTSIRVVTLGYNPIDFIVVNGGADYQVGDVLTVTVGTGPSQVSYRLTVGSVSSGLPTTSVILTVNWLGFNTDVRPAPSYTTQLSNWQAFNYTPNEIALSQVPLNNTYWYYSTASQVDIMVNKNVSASFTASGTMGATSISVSAIGMGTITVGMAITGTGIDAGTTITSLPASGTIGTYGISTPLTGSLSGTVTGSAGAAWVAYQNTAYGDNGLPVMGNQTTAANETNPTGPILAADPPLLQSDGTDLVYGDLWIDTNDLENYPALYRWQLVEGVDQWVLIDNTDQLTQNGILFADARWAPNGTVDVIDDPIPTITSLLTSNYLDLDAPDPTMYPQGTLLWNTRRSGYNVKQYKSNYFNNRSFPDTTLPQETSTWVSASGLLPNGAPYMGRKAQRNIVVEALKSTIDTNTQIRDEDTFINLIATPGYAELQQNMVTLNNDRNQTAYIVGDTPLRLAPNATDILAWATNAAGATSTGDQGLVTRDTYLGIYYPSGIGPDLTGAEVALPSSYMMMKTMLFNDTVAYPWFAPAGQRRGVVSNVTNIGYVDPASGEFVTDKNRVALRDIEYQQFINPIAYFTNVGILNYGNKNSFDSQSALDRTNVARLIAYLRYNLQRAARPFLFEPNDAFTRGQVRGVIQTLLADIQSKRGIYDYLVICDESNNTPARIDRSELWVDVAIEPVKAVEFIYIPVRILNTGEIAGLGGSL